MSLNAQNIKRSLLKFVSEDLKVILVFLMVIFTIYSVYPMMMGQMGSAFNTPSVGSKQRSLNDDSDGDLLPDVIESAEKGERVYFEGSDRFIGIGTGTDPNDRDSDNDGFTDGAEDNLGSDPNNFWSPGYLYIVWLLFIAYVLFQKFRHPDRLKEYREFEDLQTSSGVATKESKFAYGTSSIFSKRVADMTDEERKIAIEGDTRFHALMGEGVPKFVRTKRRISKKMIIQLTISVFILLVIRFVSQQ